MCIRDRHCAASAAFRRPPGDSGPRAHAELRRHGRWRRARREDRSLRAPCDWGRARPAPAALR
eukprot:6303813-Alexandrium_andersonii.AAC.1